MKAFHINQTFNVPGCVGEIVYLKSWYSGLLAGCQLVHVMMNGNPKDVWRVFKWANGDINRITRLDR